MTIILPQWQGAGDRFAIPESLERIEAILPDRGSRVPGLTDEPSATENGIRHYGSILRNLGAVARFVSTANPAKIFLLGGECSTELIPVSFLNERYGSDLSVIWFDAHADLNTPDSSPSMNFHGMPLRLLLGDGDERMKRELPGFLSPDQVVLAGVRDTDAAERDYIRRASVTTVSPVELRSGGLSRLEGLRNRLYVHVDLDVLDPGSFGGAACPAEGGIGTNDLLREITRLADAREIIGMSIVEYNDPDGTEAEVPARLVGLGASLTKQRDRASLRRVQSSGSPTGKKAGNP